jgi:hypothetical protein
MLIDIPARFVPKVGWRYPRYGPHSKKQLACIRRYVHVLGRRKIPVKPFAIPIAAGPQHADQHTRDTADGGERDREILEEAGAGHLFVFYVGGDRGGDFGCLAVGETPPSLALPAEGREPDVDS